MWGGWLSVYGKEADWADETHEELDTLYVRMTPDTSTVFQFDVDNVSFSGIWRGDVSYVHFDFYFYVDGAWHDVQSGATSNLDFQRKVVELQEHLQGYGIQLYSDCFGLVLVVNEKPLGQAFVQKPQCYQIL